MKNEKKEKIVEETVLENNEEKIPDIPDEKAKELEPPKIPTNACGEKEDDEEIKGWKQKIKSLLMFFRKDEHGKEYLKNILILLGINFAVLLLYQLYNDLNYYHNFGPNSFIGSNMRLGEVILFDAYISGYFSICQTIISALALLPTYKLKVKNRYRILIAWAITFALSIVWVINNLVVLF